MFVQKPLGSDHATDGEFKGQARGADDTSILSRSPSRRSRRFGSVRLQILRAAHASKARSARQRGRRRREKRAKQTSRLTWKGGKTQQAEVVVPDGVEDGRRGRRRRTTRGMSGHPSAPSSLPTGLGLKVAPRLRECFRQSQAEMVGNRRNKIHRTWGPAFS